MLETLMEQGLSEVEAYHTERILKKTERTQDEQKFISYIYNKYFTNTNTDIKTLVEQSDNYIPVYEMARHLGMDYSQIWNYLYEQQRQGKVEISTLQEGMFHTPEQLKWQDGQGGFFVMHCEYEYKI
jgi:hypothetical protein